MNDCSSSNETYKFICLGKVPEVKDLPYHPVDRHSHVMDILRVEHESEDLPEFADRFYKTFSGLFKFPGGDILYETDGSS